MARARTSASPCARTRGPSPQHPGQDAPGTTSLLAPEENTGGRAGAAGPNLTRGARGLPPLGWPAGHREAAAGVPGMLLLRCRCPDARRQHHFAAASASSCSVLSAAPPRQPPARPAGWAAAAQARPAAPAGAAAAARAPSPAALPRRRLRPPRLTTRFSQSLPRPARRGEANQRVRPKVFLRLGSAGLFPGEAGMLLALGWGRRGRGVGWGLLVPEPEAGRHRPGRLGGPGRYQTARSPGLGRRGRTGVTLSPEPGPGSGIPSQRSRHPRPKAVLERIPWRWSPPGRNLANRHQTAPPSSPCGSFGSGKEWYFGASEPLLVVVDPEVCQSYDRGKWGKGLKVVGGVDFPSK